ncbi:hypothetical protein LguiA_026065 [Lonicera macranthoides]
MGAFIYFRSDMKADRLLFSEVHCILSLSVQQLLCAESAISHLNTIILLRRNFIIYVISVNSPHHWGELQAFLENWWGEMMDFVGAFKNTLIAGLDLNNETISGGIDNSSSLFSLRFLESLNLADNDFNSTQIPSAFINLTSLTYLNLSYSVFGGQIPIELSQLTRLVTLDLSAFNNLKLENPNLNMFVQNLTQLAELYLDDVEISAQGYDWGQPISSSLPNLRVLMIRLSGNNLNAPVPEFLVNFKNLTALHLSSCGLNGALPEKIFHLQTLQILDLSNNPILNGSLPEFPQNGKLTELAYLDLSYNMFTGAMPWLQMSKNLTHKDLSFNNLSGPFSFTQFEGFVNLAYIDLQSNSFTGRIPSSLFGLPSLKQLLQQPF